jgi:hypothetical protein
MWILIIFSSHFIPFSNLHVIQFKKLKFIVVVIAETKSTFRDELKF